jgi:signal transduction histidine kinase
MAALPHRDRLPDAAVAVIAFAGSIVLLAAGTDSGHGDGSVNAGTVALCALSSLPLVARRDSVVGVLVVTALASIALNAVAGAVGPPLGPTVAVYWLGTAGNGTRRGAGRDLGLVAVLLVAHAAAAGLHDGRFPGTELLFGVLLWGAAWLAGDRTRLRRERMAALEERARRAEEAAERDRRLAAAEERSRIARDLHDSAGHAINVILVHAGLGRLRSGTDPAGGAEQFATIEQVARETVSEIDQLVGALREDGERAREVEPPPGLAALDGLVGRHRAAGLEVAVAVRGMPRPLGPGVDRAAFRLLQESLTNAARHGDGRAEVEVAYAPGALELTVTNPAHGAASRRDGDGHGLVGMRERAALLGGTLEAGPAGGGFRVHARLPDGDGGP